MNNINILNDISVSIHEKNFRWLIKDIERQFIVIKEDDELKIYDSYKKLLEEFFGVVIIGYKANRTSGGISTKTYGFDRNSW